MPPQARRKRAEVPSSTSRHSSKTSIISIDPAVMSQITGSAKGSTVHAGHARTESTPARTTNAPLSAVIKGHGRTNSAPSRDVKKRSNSLRRAKNSTELLKQRAIEEEKSPKYADSSIIQRGRNFTVSNVTNGGLLHLSPSPHQGAFPPVVAAPSPYPWMSATGSSVLPTTAGIEVQPQAVHSRTRSISPKRLLGGESLKKTSTEVKQLHNRSQSFSTIDESRRSVVAALQPKTLKIVIDRPESAHSTEEEEAVPTLSIPIPHYKLGTPRFSAHGTPFLRGSSYNRASSADSTNHSSMIDLSNPPSAGTKPMSKLHYTISSDESAVPMPYPLRLHKTINDQRSISVLSRVAPVTAEQYDKLLQVYNDPTVVRYANGDRESLQLSRFVSLLKSLPTRSWTTI